MTRSTTKLTQPTLSEEQALALLKKLDVGYSRYAQSAARIVKGR